MLAMTDTKVRTTPILTLLRPPHTFARALGVLIHQLLCKLWQRDIPIPSRFCQRFCLPRTVTIHLDIMHPNANGAHIAQMFTNRLPLGCNHPCSHCRSRTRLHVRPPAPGGPTRFITSDWDLASATMGRRNVSTTESSATESATRNGSEKEDIDHANGRGRGSAKEATSSSAVAPHHPTPVPVRATQSTIVTATCPTRASREDTTTTTCHTGPRRALCPHDRVLSLRPGVAPATRTTKERPQGCGRRRTAQSQKWIWAGVRHPHTLRVNSKGTSIWRTGGTAPPNLLVDCIGGAHE